MITKDEITEQYIRISNPKHTETRCQKLRYRWLSESQGINGLYCVDHEKYKTFLFLKTKWTLAQAQAWVKDHSKGKTMAEEKTEEKQEQKLYTQAFAKMFKDEDGKEKRLFVASDEEVDRQGDKIKVGGWKLANFKQNPVILWGHNQNEPPIAKAKKIGYKTIDGKKKLIFEPQFHKKDDRSRLISDLVDEGYVNATSVGFIPLKYSDKKKNEIESQELLEISFVDVGANAGALGLAMAKGYDQKTIKSVMDIDKELEKQVTSVVEKVMKKKDMTKGVIAFHSYPKASEDVAWNAGREVKAAEVSDLKKMCAWFDSSEPDSKGSYKLPHHTASGYKTVWRAVAAAMAALFGARGGVKLPSGDRRGVYNHLAKHYREFDKDVPEFRSADEIVDMYVEGKMAHENFDRFNKTLHNSDIEIKEKIKVLEEKMIEKFDKSAESLKEKEKKEVEVKTKFIDSVKEKEEKTEKTKTELLEGVENKMKELKEFVDKTKLDIEAISKGIAPKSDKSMTERFEAIEQNLENLSRDLRKGLSSSPKEEPKEVDLGLTKEKKQEIVKQVINQEIKSLLAIKKEI